MSCLYYTYIIKKTNGDHRPQNSPFFDCSCWWTTCINNWAPDWNPTLTHGTRSYLFDTCTLLILKWECFKEFTMRCFVLDLVEIGPLADGFVYKWPNDKFQSEKLTWAQASKKLFLKFVSSQQNNLMLLSSDNTLVMMKLNCPSIQISQTSYHSSAVVEFSSVNLDRKGSGVGSLPMKVLNTVLGSTPAPIVKYVSLNLIGETIKNEILIIKAYSINHW